MARGQLRGFIATPESGTTGDASKYLDVFERSSIKARTSTGEVRNAAEANAIAEDLMKLPQSFDVEKKVLDYQNKARQFEFEHAILTNSQAVFDSNLRAKLKSKAQENYTDIQGKLIPEYAQQYTDAADDYHNMILQLADKNLAITQEMMDYQDTLNKKADLYNSLANAYAWPDEDGVFGGGIQAEGYAVALETNPATRKIINIEIYPSNEIPSDYLPADVTTKMSPTKKAKQLPTWLRPSKVQTPEGVVDVAFIGDKTFVSDVKTNRALNQVKGILKYKAEAAEGRTLFQKVIGKDSAMDMKEEVIKNGISLADTASFDGYDIPNNTVVHIGSRVFFQAEDGLYEIKGGNTDEGKDNLNKFIQGYGGGHPREEFKDYYATPDYMNTPDGQSKIKATVDSNFLKIGADGALPPSSQTSMLSPSSVSSQPVATASQPSTQPQSFFGNKNRTSAPQSPIARTSADVVESGKGFFRNIANKVFG